MSFQVHGEVSLQRQGQILIANIQGPWNIELIGRYRAEMGPFVRDLAAVGPWGLIIVLHGEAACPPDALALIRQGAIEQAKNWQRVCTAYVIAPDVVGYRLMDRVWHGIYQDVIPCEIFEQREAAVAWTERMLAQ